MPDSPIEFERSCRVPIWGFRTAYVLIFTLMLGAELPIWLDGETRTERLSGWLCGREADWLPFAPVLLLVPLLRLGLRDRVRSTPLRQSVRRWLTNRPGDSAAVAWSCALLLSIAAFTASWTVGNHFNGLPPAYHDEYSYLFQAETFLAGRWAYPSFVPEPALFDQMHVLNEGFFASRYFPGTGAWMAPFLRAGNPWLGHQLAHALAAMLLFWCGRELTHAGMGLLAGLLLALSPGVLLFSSLLLAHHPALVGLLGFLYGFLRWLRTRELLAACLAGLGLSFAMLCRPMTAAGFALPMGVCAASIWLFGAATTDPFRRRTQAALALGLPIVAGFGILLWSNSQITGSPWTSPYQLYTDTYTPRHVYGFNNVVRGEQHLGPKVLGAYDRWAENLTPSLAMKNIGMRVLNSFRWTLGIVPILWGLILWLVSQWGQDRRWWLIGASVLSLHAVHIPYWFVGIMGWHYVFETAPLLLLLASAGFSRTIGSSRESGRRFLASTVGLLLVVALAVNLVTVRPLWPGQLPRGMAEVEFPRRKYAAFRVAVEQMRKGHDAVVFVIPDPADVSMDYVTNPPSLTGPVLVARVGDVEHARRSAGLFPDRVAWVYDAGSQQFSELVPPQKSRQP